MIEKRSAGTRASEDAGSVSGLAVTPPHSVEDSVSDNTQRSSGDNATAANGSSDVQGRTVRNQLMRPRTALSFLLAIAILAVFVSRTDLEPAEIWSNIRGANLWLLALGFLIYYLTLFIRAMRWRWMLDQADVGTTDGSRLPNPMYLTAVYTVSWLINCIVPAKLGDAFRAYRVKRDDGIRYSIGFGTIVAERVFDLAVLVVLLMASALLAFHGSLPGQTDSAMYLGIAMMIAVAIGLVVMYFGRSHIEALIPSRFRPHYTNFQAALFETMRRPFVPAAFAVVIWLCEGVRVFLVSESLGANVTVAMALFVALLSALLTTLPFTPAGLGVVEVAIVTALTVVDIPSDMAGSVAVLDRVITYWSVIIIGAFVAAVMLRRTPAFVEPAPLHQEPLQSTSS